MSNGGFAVVLLEELAKPPHEVAGELAKATGKLRYDVMAAFNRDPYVPLENLPGREAKAAVAVLADAGTRATALAMEKVPPPARIFNVHNADVEPDAFSVQTDIAGHMRQMPWNEIASVSVVTLSERVSTGSRAKGPSIAGGIARAAGTLAFPGAAGLMGGGRARQRRMRRQSGPTTKEVETAVLGLVPFSVPMELRIRANQFNYDYLGERLAQTSGENFRTLTGDVLARATSARVSEAARRFVEEGAAPAAMNGGRFGRLNRWLPLLAREGL